MGKWEGGARRGYLERVVEVRKSSYLYLALTIWGAGNDLIGGAGCRERVSRRSGWDAEIDIFIR